MWQRFYSFKIIIMTTIAVLILLSYGIAYYSTSVYYKLAIDNQKIAIKSLINLKNEELLSQLQETQKIFSYRLRQEKNFKTRLRLKNYDELALWLGLTFNRYFKTTGILDLEYLSVKNTSLSVLARAYSDQGEANYNGCDLLNEEISSSKGNDRLKTKMVICENDGELYSEIAIPLGGFNLSGYLFVGVNVLNTIKRIGDDLGMPIRILTLDDQELYASESWLALPAKEYLTITHFIQSDEGQNVLKIEVEANLNAFELKMKETQFRLFIIITGITWLLFIFITMLFDKAYKALKDLGASAQSLLNKEYKKIADNHLPLELEQPVAAFNSMLDGLQNEEIRRNNIEALLKKERDFINLTLDSINNAVVVVGLDLKVQLFNPIAEKMFSINENQILGKELSAEVNLYTGKIGSERVDTQYILDACQDSLCVDMTLFVFNLGEHSVELEYSCSLISDDHIDLGYLLIFRDVTDDRALRRQLSFNAYHDGLTGLLNRTAFEEKFETLIAESATNKQEHVLAYMDLDQFKVVNDTCGHAAGDLLLKQLTEMLLLQIRKTDILARLGGDEFGLILPHCSHEKAIVVIDEIIKSVVDYRFVWNEKVFSIGISIGVDVFGLLEDDLSNKMSNVDAACYLAKQSGGNQYHFCKADDVELLEQRGEMDWVAGINKGLNENRFVLYVQPIDPIGQKTKTEHFEVLIRYLDDDGSMIPPGAFLPAAERYNLIERVDMFVVSSIIQWLVEHQSKRPNILFSINLSGRSLGSKDFQYFLESIIKDSGVDTKALCFEITETAIVNDVLRSIDFINMIKKTGAKFSLDDFGSGLSSFAYLKQFPVDFLKIDGMFVKEMLSTPEDYVFVRSMTEVGHCLGMKVIAEFVETKKMFHLLREAKVDYVQGWAIGKPKPIESLLDK